MAKLTLTVAQKLGLAAAAFMLPVAFIVWSLVTEQNIAIGFARQEVLGGRYLADLVPLQQDAARLSLANGAAGAAEAGASAELAATLARLQGADGPLLDSAAAAATTLAAWRGPAGLEPGRAKLRDLIARIGDRSNLILDNVLDTYYLTDVVLNRLPDVMDRLADLTHAQATPAGDAEARAQYLVGVGGLVADLDGMDASLAAAEQAAGGGPIRAALDGQDTALKAALAEAVVALKDGKLAPATATALLGRTAAFSSAATRTLTDLLAARVQALLAAQLRALGGTALLSLLAVAAGLTAVRLGVTGPLARLRAAAVRLADGDLATPVAAATARDELGEMATALATFRQAGLDKQRLEQAAMAAQAMQARQQAALDRHTDDFGLTVNSVLATLGRSATVMRQAADGMAQAVEQTRSGSAATAAGAEASARTLAAVAAATERLTASVDEIARQVGEAANAAREAVARVQSTGATVRSLDEAASQVGSVVALISDIAGKTNLLALNATIEAARVGEAGRGFAVVASEVKQLAAQTARATDQIRGQIAGMQSRTDAAVAAVGAVTEAITRMDGVASAIATAVQQQGAATREIAASVHAVAGQNRTATDAMRDVSAVAGTASAASHSVLSAATEVAHVSETLLQEVGHFLTAVQNASEHERRRWLRIPAQRAPVTLRWSGGGPVGGALLDVSRGGASVACAATLAAGAELQIDLPDAGGAVPARVVRCGNGELGLWFRQDPATLARVDRALAKFDAAAPAPAVAGW